MADRDLIRRIDSSLKELLGQTANHHIRMRSLLLDLSDRVDAQSEGIMRLIDRLGPADPPDHGE